MLSIWIVPTGSSANSRTSLRPSFNVTSAARCRRFVASPLAMAATDFMLQGATIIPSVRNEPLEIRAAWFPCA